MKKIFLVLYLLGHIAHADLNSNLKIRIDTYNLLIEHNRSEVIALEQEIEDLYRAVKGISKDIRQTIKTFNISDLAQTAKKNGNRLANVLGASLAIYRNQDRLPSAEELKYFLNEATHPEHLYEMYEVLRQTYEARLIEIQRLEERRNQLLTSYGSKK